jgi:CYTH domain-containing protein
MGREIERRFLVKATLLPRRLPRGIRLSQGYLCLKPVVRIRLIKGKEAGRVLRALMTVKGRGMLVRPEFEFPVPLDQARGLMRMCGLWKVEKFRIKWGPWELDRYLGRYRGLWIAEIELERANQPLPRPLPPWIGREVTLDRRYTNAALARGRIPLEELMERG